MNGSLLTVVGCVAVAWLSARWLTNVVRRATGVRFGPAATLEMTGAFGTEYGGTGPNSSSVVVLYDCRTWWKRLAYLAGFGSCAGSYDGGEMRPTLHLFDLGEDGISLVRYHGPVQHVPDQAS